MSARLGYGMDELLNAIEKALGQSRHEVTLTLPYSQGGLLDTLHKNAKVSAVDYTGDGIVVDAVLDDILYGRLKEFITE
jgi:GTP-binding protein HflX